MIIRLGHCHSLTWGQLFPEEEWSLSSSNSQWDRLDQRQMNCQYPAHSLSMRVSTAALVYSFDSSNHSSDQISSVHIFSPEHQPEPYFLPADLPSHHSWLIAFSLWLAGTSTEYLLNPIIALFQSCIKLIYLLHSLLLILEKCDLLLVKHFRCGEGRVCFVELLLKVSREVLILL